MHKIIILVSAVMLASCTTELDTGRSSFTHPLLEKNPWKATAYPYEGSDTAYCVVEGGHNAIRLILELDRGDTEPVPYIESTRKMKPGAVFQVKTYAHNFRTYYDGLTASQSRAILNDLKDGKTVYLRWSEVDGDQARRHFTNRITPEKFMPPYRECEQFIVKLTATR